MSIIALSCLQIPSSPIKYGLVAVLVSTLMIVISKNGLFYDEDTRKLKDFGTAPNETIFPAWMAMFSAGYIVYMMSAAISAFGNH